MRFRLLADHVTWSTESLIAAMLAAKSSCIPWQECQEKLTPNGLTARTLLLKAGAVGLNSLR